MYCNKCGKKLIDGTKFCTNCGTKLKNGHEDQFNYSYNYNSSDDDYKKAYIGNNYDKIKDGKFSIPAFIFGGYYFLYRKLWLYAFILIITNFVITFFIKEYSSVIIIVLYILVGIKFNSFYLQKVDQNIEKIKQQNIDKTSNELLNECRKKGGVSPAAVIIVFLIIFTIGFIIGLTTTVNEIFQNIKDIPFEEKYKNNSNDTYIEELTYQIPEGFIKTNYNTKDYKSYTYNTGSDFCSIRMEYNEFTNLYKTKEEYLKSHIYTNQNDEVSNITEETINNTVWGLIKVTTSNSKEYNYATIYNNKIYNIEYKVYSNDNELCSKKYLELINSLSFTKNNNSV